MKQILIALMLLFAVTGVKAQTVDAFENADGISFGYYNADVDSVETITTSYFDASLIDNQTLYLTYLFGAGTGGGTITNDSVTLIIQGRSPYKVNGTLTYLTRDLDTLIIVGGTAASFTTLSFTSFAPEIRLKFVTAAGGTSTDNNNNRTVAVSLYAKKRDHEAYLRKHYGNLDR